MSYYEDEEFDYGGEETPPEESSNRTFMIAAGVLGGIVLLSIICLAGYVLFIMPQLRSNQNQQANVATENAQVLNAALTATFVSFSLSETPQATATLEPSLTPVVAEATETSTPVLDKTNTPDAAATQTLNALNTQLANSTQTVIATTTALPGTGFADEVGLPGLLIMAVTLVVVIFLTRRLRATPAD